MSKLLFLLMLRVIAVEYPGGVVPEAHRLELAELAPIFVATAAEGTIVSPKVDVALLMANGFHESRWWARGKDGDCSYTRGAHPRLVCSAVGPEQVSKGARHWLGRHRPEWRGITVAELRDPRTNVRAAYAILDFWAKRCGSVGKAFGAYRRGSCPNTVPLEARRRCALARGIGAALGAKPWKCGDEGVPVYGHAKRLADKAAGTGP